MSKEIQKTEKPNKSRGFILLVFVIVVFLLSYGIGSYIGIESTETTCAKLVDDITTSVMSFPIPPSNETQYLRPNSYLLKETESAQAKRILKKTQIFGET